MSNTTGVLFCGGKGTRMRPLTYYLQKVMLPIGYDQAPILEYILNHFKRYGINDIVMLVNYKKEQIEGYFGDGSKLDMNITYVQDKPGPVGTGTALLNAREFLESKRLIVYYSDIITNVNFSEMLSFHLDQKTWATILTTKGWKIRVGTAEINQKNMVTKFVEKPTIPVHVNTGISILEPVVFEHLKEFDKKTSIDLSKDIFPIFVKKNQMSAYVPADVFWEDIGSLERYEKLDHEFITSIMKK
jgi:mannose-1-phosphate guanylyltransferase